jgi:hypothetical protein
MVAKVNDNWDLDGQGIGNVTHILEVSTGEGGTTVEAAVKALQITHTVVGISGNFVAVQGDATPAVANVSVVVTFA